MPSTSNSSSVLQVKKSLKLLLVINLCRHYKRRDLFTRQFKPGVYSPLLWSCQRLMCGSKGDGSESFLKVILQCKFNKLEYSRGVVKIPRFPSPPPPSARSAPGHYYLKYVLIRIKYICPFSTMNISITYRFFFCIRTI